MTTSLRLRPFACLFAGALLLSACSGARQQARAEAGTPAVVVKGAGAKAYRFDMTQRGKKMSADDFDAWMKANGLRIAKGPDAKGAPMMVGMESARGCRARPGSTISR